MERTCKKCGKTMPLEMFYKNGAYYRNTCKDCANKTKREWVKKHGRSDETKTKDILRCALQRAKLKAETGKTYRNDKEAKRQRAYSLKYQKEHKDDPRLIETKRKCSKNANERRKIKNEVEILSEFFDNIDLF